jgi:hypothetical protein
MAIERRQEVTMPNRLKLKKHRKRAPSGPVIPVPKPPPASARPTFVATFADEETTRMSVYSGLDRPDIKRAIAVSQAAHSSRTKGKPAAIVSGHFETADGEVLRSYTADEIEKAITTEQSPATDPQARVREHELVDLTANLARVADEVGMFDNNPEQCEERDDWSQVISRAVNYLRKEEARIKQTTHATIETD